MIQTLFVTQLFARVLTLIGYNVIDNYHSELVCISDAIKTRCYFFLRCCLAYVGLNNVLKSLHFLCFSMQWVMWQWWYMEQYNVWLWLPERFLW